MINNPNPDGGSIDSVPEDLATEQQRIDHACNTYVEEYGQRYLDQVFRAIVQQINKIEAASGKKPNIHEVRKFLSQANYRHPHKHDCYQTLISYKGTPIVDIEFSDYFYIKLVQLT